MRANSIIMWACSCFCIVWLLCWKSLKEESSFHSFSSYLLGSCLVLGTADMTVSSNKAYGLTRERLKNDQSGDKVKLMKASLRKQCFVWGWLTAKRSSTIKRQVTPLVNGRRTWIDISPNKIRKWPLSMRKHLTSLVIRKMQMKTARRDFICTTTL